VGSSIGDYVCGVANGVDVQVPYELEPGVYANATTIWHTQSEFVLDFLARPVNRDEPDVARVVGRVKIPTLLVFTLIRKLSAAMSDYEHTYGEIPPHDLGDEAGP
jgi:hypothetical protein